MKKLLLLIILLLSTLLTGCGDFLVFDVNAPVQEFVVVGDPHLNHEQAPLIAAIPAVELQLPGVETAEINITDMSFIVTPTSLKSSTDEDSLDFMSTLTVSITTVTPDPRLPPQPIASWTGPAPRGTTEIVLDVKDHIDLAPYAAKGLALKVVPTGVVPYDDVSMKGDIIFLVNPM